MVYIQISNDGYVIGYSSNKMHETDLELEKDSLEERFFNLPMFYKIVEENLVFDEEKLENYKKEKENRLTNEQILGQKCSDLEIQMLMIQQLMMQQTTR